MSNLIGAFVVKKITSYEGTKVQNYYDRLLKEIKYDRLLKEIKYDKTTKRN